MSSCYSCCRCIADRRSECEGFFFNKNVVGKAKVLGIHIEVVINHSKPQTGICGRARVAVNCGVPKLWHSWSRCCNALIWRAVELFRRQTSFEVAIDLIRFTEISRRTSPGELCGDRVLSCKRRVDCTWRAYRKSRFLGCRPCTDDRIEGFACGRG